jgi:anti-sigma-K factor RskA
MRANEKERMLELLSDKAIFGLSDTELAEFEELQKKFPDFQDDSPELTAAAIGMLNLDTSEPLPAHLRSKIIADAEQYFTAQKPQNPVSEAAFKREEELQKTFSFEPEPQKSVRHWLGWAVAAVACLILVINIYTTRFSPTEIIQTTPTPTLREELTIAEQREQFLTTVKDVIRTNWTDFDPKQPKNVQGEIVWSNSAQKGFVTFRGLPVNDKTKETYQLWIFDKNRKNPVSAGVFDVTETGEIIVPLNAALQIQEPVMFGVTAEKPGGDMIPNLKNVMAVAKLSA